MNCLSRYTGWVLPAAMILITVTGGISWGAAPQIAAGANHTIFLHSDGTLWGTGLNLFGQVGDGSFTSRETPVQIGRESNWKAVSAGAEHNLAIRADGTLWAWGRSDLGQLGKVLGDGAPVPDQNAPVQIGSERNWVSVAASRGGSSYALKGDGTLWAWGDNGLGQLGLGQGTQQNTPLQVPNPSGGRYVAVAAGGEHVLALQADGSLWAWGGNSSGQLGDGSSTQRNSPVQVLVATAPSDNDWVAIAAGDSHSVALKSDGTLWGWGDNASGQLGVGSTTSHNTPVQVGSDRDWSLLAAGSLHTLLLKKNGTLWSCGDNRSGQLGNGLTGQQNSPVPIATPSLGNLVALAAGAFHSIAMKANGEIYAFGDNGTGQFGNGGSLSALSPELVARDAVGWIASEPGNQFTVARRSNGTLWSWGDNSDGELGDGSLTPRGTPAMIGSQDNWAAESAGFGHVVALRADGTLWSWGDNSSGQLGDDTLNPSAVPEQITATFPASASDDWAAVAAGDFHTLALKADGTLWSWGDNSSGQLGNGSNVAQGKLPGRVVTGNPGNFDSNWVAIAAGGSHSLGLQSDGSLWVWGDNTLGQLGDPSLAGSVNTPSQIVNFTPPPGNLGFNSGWRWVSAGLGHSLGLQADGTLWSWGSNFSGQLGNGDPASPNPARQPVPVQVLNPGSAPYVAALAGDAHSVARQADGTLWSWGSNTSGQLGNGSSDPDPFHPLPHTTPVAEALGVADWVSSGIGGSHSIGIRVDGTLWGMGSNQSGQLGDGSTSDRSAPTPLLEGFLAVAGSLNFTAAAIGGGATSLPLSIGNPGNGMLFVTGITLSGSDSGVFGLQAGSCPAAGSFALPAKGSCQLQVTFTPAAPAGVRSAQLRIDSKDPLRPQTLVDLSASSVVPFIVTTSTTPAGGTISPAGPVLAVPGSSPVFTIAANAGYHLADVMVNGISQGAVSSITLASIGSDAVIQASFAPNPHVITLAAGSNGSISGPTSTVQGATPSYTVIPATGFHVADVTLNGVSQGAVSSLTLAPVTADVTIAASFAINSYRLTLSAGEHGTISGPTTATFGATPSFSITPDTGSFITAVTVNGVSQGVISSLTLPPVGGDVTVTATFGVTTFSIAASSDARGSVSPAGSTLVPYGSSQTFTFTPNPGYQVVKVVVDGVSQGALPSYTFSNVTAGGHAVQAFFIPDGDLNNDGVVDIADALRALQVAVGVVTPSQSDLLHGDVAPLDARGVPAPDHQIGVADALLILRKAVGLTSGF